MFTLRPLVIRLVVGVVLATRLLGGVALAAEDPHAGGITSRA